MLYEIEICPMLYPAVNFRKICRFVANKIVKQSFIWECGPIF